MRWLRNALALVGLRLASDVEEEIQGLRAQNAALEECLDDIYEFHCRYQSQLRDVFLRDPGP